jgi:hypothetical protein
MPHLNSKFVTAHATPYKGESLASQRLSQKSAHRNSTELTGDLGQTSSTFGGKVPSPKQLFATKSKRQQLDEWVDFERRSRLEKSSLNAMTENSVAYLEKITDAVRAERRALLFADLRKQREAAAEEEGVGENRMESQRGSLVPLPPPEHANSQSATLEPSMEQPHLTPRQAKNASALRLQLNTS